MSARKTCNARPYYYYYYYIHISNENEKKTPANLNIKQNNNKRSILRLIVMKIQIQIQQLVFLQPLILIGSQIKMCDYLQHRSYILTILIIIIIK